MVRALPPVFQPPRCTIGPLPDAEGPPPLYHPSTMRMDHGPHPSESTNPRRGAGWGARADRELPSFPPGSAGPRSHLVRVTCGSLTTKDRAAEVEQFWAGGPSAVAHRSPIFAQNRTEVVQKPTTLIAFPVPVFFWLRSKPAHSPPTLPPLTALIPFGPVRHATHTVPLIRRRLCSLPPLPPGP